MRADALRNRERIAAAALALFAERGAEVPMEEIAKAAGLGVGTLYRHFPDRRALVEEIGAGTLRRLLEFGHGLGADGVPGWAGLLRFVEYCAGQPLALIKTLAESTPAPPERAVLEAETNAMMAGLAERAQKEGTMRGDIAPRDVVEVLSAAVCRPGARADDALTTVVLDGLRA